MNRANNDWVAKLFVHPIEDRCDVFAQIEFKSQVKCRVKIYSGFSAFFFYCEDLFHYLIWETDQQITISGKTRETEIKIFVDDCRLEVVNLTLDGKPTIYESMQYRKILEWEGGGDLKKLTQVFNRMFIWKQTILLVGSVLSVVCCKGQIQDSSSLNC